MIEWHPFSISSCPDDQEVEINIKCNKLVMYYIKCIGNGNFTNKLYARAKDINREIDIKVDGPYGTLNLNYRRYPVIVLVAGGIGITPILGILKDIYRIGKLSPQDRKSAVEQVHLIWSITQSSVYKGFQQDMTQIEREADRTVI